MIKINLLPVKAAKRREQGQKQLLAGGSARVPPLLQAIEGRARVPVELMDPFKNAQIASNVDEAFVRAHGSQGVVSLGLALRSPGDKFE